MTKLERARLKIELLRLKEQIPEEYLTLVVRSVSVAFTCPDFYSELLILLKIKPDQPNWDNIVSKALTTRKIYARD